MIGTVWGLFLVGALLASSVMAILWVVQVQTPDASHVDVAWVLIACAAILYALLADRDSAHRAALAAVLA